MPRYKVSGPRPVHGTPPGELLEQPLTDDEEADLLSAGRVEIVPSRYRVVGPNEVHTAKPGKTFEKALTAGQERTLIDGGHIQPVPARGRAPSTSTQPPAGGKE